MEKGNGVATAQDACRLNRSWRVGRASGSRANQLAILEPWCLGRRFIELARKRTGEGFLGRECGLLSGGEVVTGHGDWLGGASECVPDDGLILGGDKQHPDGGLMLRPPQPVLHESDVEAELTGIARLELCGLQFDDHIPKLVNVEEQ